MPTVSIIVIAYKVDRFLRQCLGSLMTQSYPNLEIICVVGEDDELCARICDELSFIDRRIRVIRETPRGTAQARNTGLDAATGEYIAFVDGDDFADSNMIEAMLFAAMKAEADISVIGRCFYYKNCMEGDPEAEEIRVLTVPEALEIILYQTGFFLHIWDKLYRRTLFEGIRFDTGRKVEDRFVCYRLIKKANCIVYNSTPQYYFRMSEDSGSRVEDNLVKSFEADKQICRDMMETYPELLKAAEYFIAYEAISVVQNSMLYGSFSKKHDEAVLRSVRSFSASLRHNPKVRRSVKVKAFLCLHFPGILKKLTLKRRKRFLASHQFFTTGADWNRVYEEQGVE